MGVAAVGDGVLRMGADGEYTCQSVRLKPFGLGGVGGIFTMQVLAWTPDTGHIFGGAPYQSVPPNKVWLKSTLATYNVVLGTDAGPFGGDLGTNYNFANAVTLASGPAAVVMGAVINDWFFLAGEIYMPTFGARYLEFLFALGTATGANCLVLRS